MNRLLAYCGRIGLSAGLPPVLTGTSPLRAADRPASAPGRPRDDRVPVRESATIDCGAERPSGAHPLVLPGLLLIVLAVLVGCARGPEPAKTGRQIRIGLSMDSFVVERWIRDRDIFVTEANSLGAQVVVTVANQDHETQVRQIKELANQDIDVLVVVPNDSTRLGPTIRFIRDRGIPVMSYDRLILKAKSDLYVAHDHVAAGELMGEAVVRAAARRKPANPYALYIVNGAQSDYNSLLMNQGYRQAIDPLVKSGQIAVVKEIWLQAWSSEEAETAFRAALEAGHRPDGVIAANDLLAESLIRVLSQKRLLDGTLMTGMDADLAACQRVIEGTQTMTVYKPIAPLAKAAATYALKLARREPLNVTEFINDGEYPVPYVKLQPIGVDRGNMKEVIVKEGFHRAEEIYRNQADAGGN